MFGLKPLIKEKYDYITSKVSKNESIATIIIGQQDIIEFVDNALASPLTINVLFNGSRVLVKPYTFKDLERSYPTRSIMTLATLQVQASYIH